MTNQTIQALRDSVMDLLRVTDHTRVPPTTAAVDPLDELIDAALWELHEIGAVRNIRAQRDRVLPRCALVTLCPSEQERDVLKAFVDVIRQMPLAQPPSLDAVDPSAADPGKLSPREKSSSSAENVTAGGGGTPPEDHP